MLFESVSFQEHSNFSAMMCVRICNCNKISCAHNKYRCFCYFRILLFWQQSLTCTHGERGIAKIASNSQKNRQIYEFSNCKSIITIIKNTFCSSYANETITPPVQYSRKWNEKKKQQRREFGHKCGLNKMKVTVGRALRSFAIVNFDAFLYISSPNKRCVRKKKPNKIKFRTRHTCGDLMIVIVN